MDTDADFKILFDTVSTRCDRRVNKVATVPCCSYVCSISNIDDVKHEYCCADEDLVQHLDERYFKQVKIL